MNRLLALITILGVLAIPVLVIYVNHLQAERIAENSQTRVALCALRADLDKRIESSETFLAEHPQGIPGIPASLIRQGLVNSKRTRKTLEILTCSA
jgi:hypothetical protein